MGNKTVKKYKIKKPDRVERPVSIFEVCAKNKKKPLPVVLFADIKNLISTSRLLNFSNSPVLPIYYATDPEYKNYKVMDLIGDLNYTCVKEVRFTFVRDKKFINEIFNYLRDFAGYQINGEVISIEVKKVKNKLDTLKLTVKIPIGVFEYMLIYMNSCVEIDVHSPLQYLLSHVSYNNEVRLYGGRKDINKKIASVLVNKAPYIVFDDTEQTEE